MRYLKKYEDTNYQYSEYKGDDYVIIKKDTKRIKYMADKWSIYPYHCVKILHYNGDAYYIESFDVKNNENICLWINLPDIERKATSEEIVQYKANKESNKYNL